MTLRQLFLGLEVWLFVIVALSGAAQFTRGTLQYNLIGVVCLVVAWFLLVNIVKKFKAGHHKNRKKQEAQPQAFDATTGEVYQPATFRAVAVDEWENTLKIAWEGAEDITFSYKTAEGKSSRRKVTLLRILQGDNALYFRGFCHTQEDERTFNVKRIASKIDYAGQKFTVYDFLVHEIGIDNLHIE